MLQGFFWEVMRRDPVLGYFGLANLVVAVVLIAGSFFNRRRVMGVNSLIKPTKFALSIGILSCTMAWFTADLQQDIGLAAYRWSMVGLLGFEIVYITAMGMAGRKSHYNVSSPLTSALHGLMGLAATIATLWTGFVGLQFVLQDLPGLPGYYRWSIALGSLLFAAFGMEGALMGSRMSHTIEGPDGGSGLPFLNWSRTYGDARIAHFVGMHALQILPLASFYLLKDLRLTFVLAGLYGLLSLWTLALALRARPLPGLGPKDRRGSAHI